MTKLIYWYHGESDCYGKSTRMEWRKMQKTYDGGLCTQMEKEEWEKAQNKASDGNYRVSQSKVKTYRKCPYAYHLKYVENLKRKRKSRPLMFGSIIHNLIESWAEGEEPMEILDDIGIENMALFRAEKDEYGELVADTRMIMEDYFDYWPEDSLKFARIKRRSAEHNFEIEIIPGVIWNGKIDAIAKTPNKLRWVVEHKSFKRKPGDDDRWRNIQSTTYFRAIDIMGWGHVDGTVWDYIKSKPPVMPGLLKDGKLSSKNIDTLPTAVRAAIKQHGLRERHYEWLISKAEANRPNYFSRIFTPVDQSVRDAIYDDFVHTIREMVETHGKRKYKNVDRHCGWCDYEGICRAELTGADVDFVKEREYVEETSHTQIPGFFERETSEDE